MWPSPLSPLPQNSTDYSYPQTMWKATSHSSHLLRAPFSRVTSEPIINELIRVTSQPLLCWAAVVTELLRTACYVPNSQVCGPTTSPLLSADGPLKGYITPPFQNLPHPFKIFTTPTKQIPLRHLQHRGCGIWILVLTSKAFLNFHLLS